MKFKERTPNTQITIAATIMVVVGIMLLILFVAIINFLLGNIQETSLVVIALLTIVGTGVSILITHKILNME